MRISPSSPRCHFLRLAAAHVLVLLTINGCGSPTDGDAELVELIIHPYRFACGEWTPSPPRVERATFDLRLNQSGTDTAPSPALIAAIEAEGGHVVYRFNGPMVRAELNVGAVPRLTYAGGPVNAATVVTALSQRTVTLRVVLDREVGDVDLRAVEALGGRVTHVHHSFHAYVAEIDDARVPELRVLPGVHVVSFVAVYCQG